MKTLIVNGSPRKDGDTMTLVREMQQFLQGETVLINTYDEGISPCRDCRYCWENPGCSIEDGMQRVYTLLDEVDNVILASPVYFSELTGPLLGFTSRLQTYYAAEHLRHDKDFALKEKNGALVLAAGGDTKDMQRAISTARILFRHMNARLIGNAVAANTNELPASRDTAALHQAGVLALRLNELHDGFSGEPGLEQPQMLY